MTSGDIERLMARLGAARPVFHSEADFQLGLAWQVRLDHPEARLRLETVLLPGRALDLFAQLGDRRTGIELKYLVRSYQATVEDERFNLRNQSAQDTRRYDVIKDVVRIEDLIDAGLIDRGYVVAVTNDPSYWTAPRTVTTSDAAFRLHEGRRLAQSLGWGPRTGPGTMRGREPILDLRGSYPLAWREYSRLDDRPGGLFRYLLVSVEAPLGASVIEP